jgi:hypothetical protein
MGQLPSRTLQFSLRQLAVLTIAAAVGWLAWVNPAAVNPLLAATAVYAVVDRYVAIDKWTGLALRQAVLLAAACMMGWLAWRYPAVVNPVVVAAAVHAVVNTVA